MLRAACRQITAVTNGLTIEKHRRAGGKTKTVAIQLAYSHIACTTDTSQV